jgi:hypothetical protein
MTIKESPERLALRLETDAGKTLEFFKNLEPEMWLRQVYPGENGWNPRQILAHFVSAETSFEKLIDNILNGGEGASANFIIDQFNDREVGKLAEADPKELLSAFLELRGRTVILVKNMQKSDLAKMGRHPFLGITHLVDIIKMVYRHNQIHLRDIRQSGLFD